MSIQTVITISSKYLLIIVSYIYIHNTNIHITAFDNRIYYNVTFYTVTANKTYTVCRKSKYYKYKHGFFFAHALHTQFSVSPQHLLIKKVIFCLKFRLPVVRGGGGHHSFWGLVPGLGGLKETKMFLPHPRVKVSIVGSLRDREVARSASDRQGSNFESCVWRTVSSQSSHHPQEVLLAQFSLYVHKGGLKPDSFHFIIKLKIYS